MENYLTDRYLQSPDGTFPHMGVKDGDVAPFVLLCGDPGRVELIKESLSSAEAVGQTRGYLVYSGIYKDVPISVATSGVGSPSAAIALEELGASGGKVFIRVGSCASIHPEAGVGSIIIATAAVRDEGTSHYFAPDIYPAVADHQVVSALSQAATASKAPYHLGVIRSTDSFYEGERKREIIDRWRERNVIAFEMESSALFTIGSIFGFQCGTILIGGSDLIYGKSPYKGEGVDEYKAGVEKAISITLEAVYQLNSILD